jgi:hypothetical protein
MTTNAISMGKARRHKIAIFQMGTEDSQAKVGRVDDLLRYLLEVEWVG